MSAINVLEIRGLRKSFGAKEVLHGIDLNIARGQLVGFLGPNGAGKTTTLRIVMGLMTASAGEIRVFGESIPRHGSRLRRHIGYLPGEVRFYPNASGRSNLKFLERGRGADCRAECERLADVFDLELGKGVRKYSTGMKQKLGLIQAMMHRPELLILDEPTSGLDPLVRKAVFAELRSRVRDGSTVLFSSHTLSEVDELCDEVIILREGSVVEQQGLATFRKAGLRHVHVVFDSPGSIPSELPQPFTVVARSGNAMEGTWSGTAADLLEWLHTQAIADITIEPPNLEDLFLAFYAQGDRPR